MKAILVRNYKKDCTMGVFTLISNDKVVFIANTLELVDKDNQFQISCIPKGTYKVTSRESEKYGKHYILADVLNRDAILIHVGNYTKDTHGCILLGVKGTENTIQKSRVTLDKLLSIAPDGFTLTII